MTINNIKEHFLDLTNKFKNITKIYKNKNVFKSKQAFNIVV